MSWDYYEDEIKKGKVTDRQVIREIQDAFGPFLSQIHKGLREIERPFFDRDFKEMLTNIDKIIPSMSQKLRKDMEKVQGAVQDLIDKLCYHRVHRLSSTSPSR